jgi:DNA-binding response OmpR family regulator
VTVGVTGWCEYALGVEVVRIGRGVGLAPAERTGFGVWVAVVVCRFSVCFVVCLVTCFPVCLVVQCRVVLPVPVPGVGLVQTRTWCIGWWVGVGVADAWATSRVLPAPPATEAAASPVASRRLKVIMYGILPERGAPHPGACGVSLRRPDLLNLAQPSGASSGRHESPRRLAAAMNAASGVPAPASRPWAAPVLVVDDDLKTVALVRAYLEREGFEVVEAHDGPAALAAVEAHGPQLVVLDVMLPELDGLGVLRRLRESSDIPVLMLSARGATDDRVQGIREGADDYLPKPFSPSELVVRVQAILRRGTQRAAREGDRGRLRHADLVIDLDRHEVTRAGRPLPLTTAEFRLLAALVEAEGRVLTREVLLDALYGHGYVEVLDRTIDVHIRRLREKLGDDADDPRYIATVRGAGYRAAPGR